MDFFLDSIPDLSIGGVSQCGLEIMDIGKPDSLKKRILRSVPIEVLVFLNYMKLKNTSSYEEDYRETSHPPCEGNADCKT